MPHVSSSGGGDDLGSEDEVKVFKDEGEEEKRSSENLTEDKSDLIDLTESEVDPTPHTSSFNMGYLVSPYPYPNGAGGPIPVSMVSSPVMLPLVLFSSKIWHVPDLPPARLSFAVPFVLDNDASVSRLFVRALI
ncbi:hypothetical protein P5V15_007606 [Pogonomyrmex californicus]